MARLILLVFCLLLLFALNSALSWGNFDGTWETNNNVPNTNGNNNNRDCGGNSLVQSPDQIDATIEDYNNLIGSVDAYPSGSSQNYFFSNFQPRIAASSTRATITYRLGKRINGKQNKN